MKRCRLLLLTLTLILCLCAPAQAAELPFLREEEAREDCALLLEESADGVADLALALLELWLERRASLPLTPREDL